MPCHTKSPRDTLVSRGLRHGRLGRPHNRRASCLLGLVEGLLGHRSEIGERGIVLIGDLGEDLAVELDARKFQAMHEPAVRELVHAGGSVDTLDPQGADVALLVATVTVGILPRVLDLLLHAPEGARAGAIIPLGALD